MMAISSPQYVWTLFLRYFLHTAGGGAAAVQVTFSLLVVLQTVFPPAQRWTVRICSRPDGWSRRARR